MLVRPAVDERRLGVCMYGCSWLRLHSVQRFEILLQLQEISTSLWCINTRI